MLLAIIKRCLMGLASYLVAVIAFFPVFAVLSGIVSLIEPESGKWTVFAVSPIVLISAPALGLFAAITAITLTFLPAAVFAVVAEALALRHAWLYLSAGAFASIGCFWSMHPLVLTASDLLRIDTLIIAIAGSFSGLVIWLIFGRNAGKWRLKA